VGGKQVEAGGVAGRLLGQTRFGRHLLAENHHGDFSG
jgi:hypothetical protein